MWAIMTNHPLFYWTKTLYEMDTSLRQTAAQGPMSVHLKEISLYDKVLYSLYLLGVSELPWSLYATLLNLECLINTQCKLICYRPLYFSQKTSQTNKFKATILTFSHVQPQHTDHHFQALKVL